MVLLVLLDYLVNAVLLVHLAAKVKEERLEMLDLKALVVL